MRKPLRMLPVLLALSAVPLAAVPAHAGGTCFAVHADAPIYAGASPWTGIVGCLDPGTPVNGTRHSADERPAGIEPRATAKPTKGAPAAPAGGCAGGRPDRARARGDTAIDRTT
ncbi:hypothetical protein [Streptomyces atratus]|uniref:hypothetical protein n=1 Tax=Streptomyces atratus TaxID=1893 RepID=UPI001300A076|nr:hypothetical protein [Streptomyces atratus]